jgi:site-specific DNA-cytosine methylase
MLVFDLFAGTGSATKAFEDAGHSVIKIELDEQFQADMHVDIMTLTSDALLTRYGRPDFVWASPPCTAFSVASIGHHWNTDHTPKTLAAIQSMKLVSHTRALLEDLRPRLGFVIENPRGKLRKLPMLETLTRHTVTYCAYGDDRMKPTDLWTTVEGWQPRPLCKNGDPCHESAPRGAKTGTQGRGGASYVQ